MTVIPEFLKELKRKNDLVLVMGARVQLLGRIIARNKIRHYLGRVFATLASIVLKLPVYDTQCGAKLFVTTEAIAFAFNAPFISRWIFDVELIARLVFKSRVNAFKSICEFPLEEWHDVKGSKIRLADFWIAICDLGRIYYLYTLQSNHELMT